MNFFSGEEFRESANVAVGSLGLEGLHPDLQGAIFHHPLFGTLIDHPLVKMTNLNLPFPEFFADATGATSWAALANIQLAQKREGIQKAIAERDWTTYVFLHERPHRFEALASILNDGFAPIDQLWPLVGDVWSDSENIWQYADEWLILWRQPSRRKRTVMSKIERDSWRALPDSLTIYRGANCEDEDDAEFALMCGQSWTLNRDKAIWFSNRRSLNRPFVAEASIRKKHCFAYFSGRNEDEIVIDPDHVMTFKMMDVSLSDHRGKESFG